MMDLDKTFVVGVSAKIDRSKYQTTVLCAKHVITADEPLLKGGLDMGPDPYELLLSSLGSCTAITLRMYIDRKMWNIEEIAVDLELFKMAGSTLIERRLNFGGAVTTEQRTRLAEIANACPIHKILSGHIVISTSIS